MTLLRSRNDSHAAARNFSFWIIALVWLLQAVGRNMIKIVCAGADFHSPSWTSSFIFFYYFLINLQAIDL